VATLDVERGGVGLAVEGEGNVLGGESAGEDGERGVHAYIVTDARRIARGEERFFLIYFSTR